MTNKLINYRGIAPAHIVNVLEGDGKDMPFQIVKYAVGYENLEGITRMYTIGKIVPLTDDEKSSFE